MTTIHSEYDFVQPCLERPDTTQIALSIDSIGGREVLEPLTSYLMVENKGDYHFRMADASFGRQPDCPGETEASYDKLPSSFGKQ